jgi:hypothetical protein
MTMQSVTDPGVWTGVEFDKKEAIVFELGARHLAEMDANLKQVRARDLKTESIERQDFPLHAIADELSALSAELQDGKGLLVVRGFPIDEYSLTDLEILYWGFGTHLGVAVSQSVMGDRLGHVIDVTDTDPHARAYRNHQELTLHTDFSDVVSFLSVRKAKLGGLSWFASALAVHNEIQRTRPDLLAVLYRGYYWHRFSEEGPQATPITPWRVPVFSCCLDKVSCRFIRAYITEAAAHESVEALTDIEVEALDYFEEVAHRDGMPIKFMMEPGEAVFINNFTTLHAREAFENHPEMDRRRLLLRLWMTVPAGRPIVPEVQIYDSGRAGGVPSQPGRTPSYARKAEADTFPS